MTVWPFRVELPCFFPFTFPSSLFLSHGLRITFSSRIMRILFDKYSPNLEMEWNIRFWAWLNGIAFPLIVCVH
ncbi:hypothetical protein AMTRI_Chr01g113630 [Amborella trichopoda]